MPRLNRDYVVYVGSIANLSGEQQKSFADAAGSSDFGYHAGLTETSLIMHLRPDLVHMDAADTRDCESLNRLEHITKRQLMTGFSWYANYPNHFAGSPEAAKPELGKILADMITDNLAEAIRAVKADSISPDLAFEFAARAAKPDAGTVTR
jgi:creatinine amidohydrolase